MEGFRMIETCGEVGTSFTTDHEPHFTDPCSLWAGHDELHDWARREAAGEPSPAERAEGDRDDVLIVWEKDPALGEPYPGPQRATIKRGEETVTP
jgi:hypothetical protein